MKEPTMSNMCPGRGALVIYFREGVVGVARPVDLSTKGYTMNEPAEYQVQRRILTSELGKAQLNQDILCAMLTAMRAQYAAEGVLDDHLMDHVGVLMSQLWNALAMMTQALQTEDIPF